MALVSAQYSDSEGELSDEGRRRRDEDDDEEDDDDFEHPKSGSSLPFRLTVNEPHGGVSGGSSGQNTPPPPPRGGRALSGSPDVISASLLGSRQQTPKSGVDSPLIPAPPGSGGGGGGGGVGISKLAQPSQGLSGLVGYHGDDDDDDDDDEGDETKGRRRRSAADLEADGNQGLVPDYMDISSASYMLDKTLQPPLPPGSPPPSSSDLGGASAYGVVPPPAVPSAPVVGGAIQIPPEPPGRCSKQLQEKIAEQYERYLREGIDYNKFIQKKKDFKNPSIYEKLIEYSGIYEFGTNYSPDVYDPQIWGPESNYEELAKSQKTEMDKREEKRKAGDVRTSKVEFVSGTAKKNSSASSTNVAEGGGETKEKKRKSKWDQGSTDGSAPPPPPVGVASSASLSDVNVSSSSAILTQATGTKTTVISAVGGLLSNKKKS